jgi:PPOX class probable F420-dependent enzyme
MPKPPLPPRVEALVRQPNEAVVASIRPDGTPHTAATWYDWEDGRILLNMDAGRRRLDFMRRDPRVSLTVLADGNWYRHITLEGEVEEIVPDEGLRDIDRLCTRYLGQPYSNRDDPRVSAWVRVTRWHGWDAAHPIERDEDFND